MYSKIYLEYLKKLLPFQREWEFIQQDSAYAKKVRYL